MPMATKLDSLVTYGGVHRPVVHMTFLWCGHVTNEKPYNCISTIPIASKSGRVET